MMNGSPTNPLPDLMESANLSPPQGKRKRAHASFSSTAAHPEESSARLFNDGDNPSYQRKRSRRSGSSTRSADQQRGSLPRSTRKLRLTKHEVSPRPSRFIEGSMSDRISTKPPSIYIKEEKAMEAYMDEPCTMLEALGARPSRDLEKFDAKVETCKPSGMYRFGRAIANAFKPSAFWGEPKGKKPRVDSSKVAAEKGWGELKDSGFVGCKVTPINADPSNHSKTKTKNDVVIGHSTIQSSDQLNAHVTLASYGERQMIDREGNRCTSFGVPEGSSTPSSATERRSRSFLRSPSLYSLRKATSHIQLPSAKMKVANDQNMEDAPDIPPIPVSFQTLRKEPSKKDLAKQQKLSNRVSNLEAQLETARRELQQSIGVTEPSPQTKVASLPVSRRPFVPGLLPSLPSERLLNAKLGAPPNKDAIMSQTSELSHEPLVCREQLTDGQVPCTPQSKVAPRATLEAAAQLERELAQSLCASTLSKKRKSLIEGESQADGKENASNTSPSVATKRNRSSRPADRPRKARLVVAASSPLHDEPLIPPLPARNPDNSIAATVTPTLAPPRRSPSKSGSNRSALKSTTSPASDTDLKVLAPSVYGSRSPLGSLSTSTLNILPPVQENSTAVVNGLVKNPRPATSARASSTPVIPKEDFEWPEDVF